MVIADFTEETKNRILKECNGLKFEDGLLFFNVLSEDGKKYQDEELQYCYNKGFDNIKNGSNATNSNYSIFSTKEKLKAWEHGRDDASSETQEGGNNNGK